MQCWRSTRATLTTVFSLQRRAYTVSTFEQAGLPTTLLDALSKAFPHVEHPTASQAALLKALIPPSQRRSADSRSLILRDVTGSGKSLALLLGLLAQRKDSRRIATASKTARLERLLFVPHSEVARQYEYWLDLLRSCAEVGQSVAASDISAMAPVTAGATALARTSVVYKGQAVMDVLPETDFLIATPAAFIEVVPHLNLAAVDTIALDEADAMLYLPNTRFGSQRQAEKWQRHPPPVVGIMNELLGNASDASTSSKPLEPRKGPARDQNTSKRIIVVSATANSVLRDWIVRRSGWIGSKGVLGERQLDWYDFAGSEHDPQTSQGQEDPSAFQTVGKVLLPKADIEHVHYRVDEEGMLVNPSVQIGQPAHDSGKKTAPSNLEPLFTAAATLFALNRLSSVLLIIPSTQSLSKTLDFFHSLDVPATTVQDARDLPADEPRLYVTSSSSVRGLDLPSLEEVFILPGTVEDAQAYLHVAGRVGRMAAGQRRAKGKVVSLTRSGADREEGRIKRFWELLGIDGKAGTIPRLSED